MQKVFAWTVTVYVVLFMFLFLVFVLRDLSPRTELVYVKQFIPARKEALSYIRARSISVAEFLQDADLNNLYTNRLAKTLETYETNTTVTYIVSLSDSDQQTLQNSTEAKNIKDCKEAIIKVFKQGNVTETDLDLLKKVRKGNKCNKNIF